MKLYVSTLEYQKVNTTAIKEYKYKEETIKYIITKEGMYQYTDSSIRRIDIFDVPTKQVTIKGDVEIVCDNSKYVTGPEWYQIPTKCVEDNKNRVLYRLRPKALVDLVIETNDNNDIISSLYFQTDEELISHGIEEDIISFLTSITFC